MIPTPTPVEKIADSRYYAYSVEGPGSPNGERHFFDPDKVLLDLVTAKLRRKLYEIPVGFKLFVDGLLGFGGEESAGASYIRLDGSAWTTDKDGIVPALLSAEISARMGRDPASSTSNSRSSSANRLRSC